jgi:hypothetical protein
MTNAGITRQAKQHLRTAGITGTVHTTTDRNLTVCTVDIPTGHDAVAIRDAVANILAAGTTGPCGVRITTDGFTVACASVRA